MMSTQPQQIVSSNVRFYTTTSSSDYMLIQCVVGE